MGNTNSTESNVQQRRSRNNSNSTSVSSDFPTITAHSNNNNNNNSNTCQTEYPQLSVTEPPPEIHPTEVTKVKQEPKETTKAVPVATGKSGWVSSATGGASPWFNSLSSSTSSHQHRASISGPYYRARGMSITRDSENDEEPITPTTATTTATTATAPTKAQGVPTIITWTQGGNNVYVTGTFNGWKHKIKLVKSTHDFNAVLELPPGTHRLKFIVDDEWKCSNDLETATDPDGNLVNYLQVMDEEEEERLGEGEEDMVSSTESIDEEYTNTIPPELLALSESTESDGQRKSSTDWEKKQPQPPILPPHLDKVLLNSQTVSEEDNSVLQEPNHVTLNHLYACSIKDNVMALATTTRYRKKYVTTMYYRPAISKN
ncbi:hypothetical protein RMCBS344292_06626 [Rhizopus microsporus]|nr:hypothetical protein RMCBS344292_06626 [Rhizopus microsporus]